MSDATRLKCTVYVGSYLSPSSPHFRSALRPFNPSLPFGCLVATANLVTQIGGLDKTVTKPVLQQAFLPFGEVVEVNIPTATDEQHQHRGFGYVEFENQEDAAAAIDNMDQAMLAGRFVTVAQAKPQKDVGNVLGSKVAVWEQVCLLGWMWIWLDSD